MKQKVKLTDFNGNVQIKEISIKEKDHLKAQQLFKSKIIKPKKGKGSYKREKYSYKEE